MSKSTAPSLLPFQRSLLAEIHDPTSSELVLVARGLGLRKIVCTLLQIYDGPQNLVLLVNATPEEEKGIGSELGVMGVRNPGLRIVDYEMSKKDRWAFCAGVVATLNSIHSISIGNDSTLKEAWFLSRRGS